MENGLKEIGNACWRLKMQTKPMSERIAEFKEENEYFFSDQNPFPDCANRWKEHSEKAVSIINKLEAENETLLAKNKELENELIKSSQDWQSLSKDYVQIEEENEALKGKLKEYA